MKEPIILILAILLFPILGIAQLTNQKDIEMVTKFIDRVKNGKIEEMSKLVLYPLHRENPLPDIKNEQEFKSRYSELFDNSLTERIIHSNSSRDWSAMGWRGIMFNDGLIWLDDNGKLSAVNYVSHIEEQKKKELIAEDKKNIHPSIQNFERSICIIETSKFIIRIDEVYNGYRYASWSKNQSMKEKPDLIITNGKLQFDGSGGNHHYTFNNGDYTYECFINVLKESTISDATFILSKQGKTILSQNGNIDKTISPTTQKSLSQDEILNKVLLQLKLKNEEVYEQRIAIKQIPYEKTKSVVVIPKIVLILNPDYDEFEADAYILIIDNTNAKILHTFYESHAWTSDAVKLTDISIDFAPYQLNALDRAFGVRVNYEGSSKPNPYSNQELSLFVVKQGSLIEVLRKFEIEVYRGEWDTRCSGDFTVTKTVLMMATTTTNGYYDIVAKRTSHTKLIICIRENVNLQKKLNIKV